MRFHNILQMMLDISETPEIEKRGFKLSILDSFKLLKTDFCLTFVFEPSSYVIILYHPHLLEIRPWGFSSICDLSVFQMSCGQRSHLCVVANVFALERSTICCSIQRPILLIVVEFTIVPLRRWDRDRKTLPRRPSALFCLHRTPSFLSLQNIFQHVESVGFLNLPAMRHIAFEWILLVTVRFRITLGLILDVYFLLIWKMTLIYVDICAQENREPCWL